MKLLCKFSTDLTRSGVEEKGNSCLTDQLLRLLKHHSSMLTFASELFLSNLAKQSFRLARDRGRHVIRYEDIAEARTTDPALSFLDMLLP